jgi:uncharacterized LabA/DUF88 family protein
VRFCIIVDGTNFINRLFEMGKGKSFVLNELSFPKIAEAIQRLLKDNGLPALYNGTYFYCPNKKISNLTKDETDQFLDKLRHERGVTVEQVGIITDGKEKALDTSIIIRMFEIIDYYDIVVLLASDRDYIPAFELLRKKGKYIITVGCKENHPIELINKSYLFLEIENILKNQFKI